ncbi:NACHT and WD repeat domain-containing protein [Streptomyces bottropensis]|uniref:NACHT and WD repeat domain-containing protein n=1 Tax=Streptomyces bottropensis TaxID=42235 RepID=UPI003698CC4B
MSELPPQAPMSPSAEDCKDPFAFGEAFTRLRSRARISLRMLQKSCAEDHPVSHSTIEHWGKGGVVSESNEPAFRLVLQKLGVTQQADLEAWLQAARALRSWRQRPSIAGPYRGLKSYDSDYAQVFFGRELLVKRVLSELEAVRGKGGTILLTGASGTGKSSLLKAGVVPALRAGKLPGSADWPTVSMIAESDEPDPLDSLAKAMASCAEAELAEVTGALHSGPQAVEALMQQIVTLGRGARPGGGPAPDADSRVVVIIDQFERALVSAEDGPGSDERLQAFYAVLRTMTSAPTAAIVILSVRLDFLNAALQSAPSPAGADRRPPVFVEPIGETDLTAIIEMPARAFKVNPEAGFAGLVLGDISARGGRLAHQTGVLPLLSHALQMTWERGGGREMTKANYRAVGGVEGALRVTAEEIYAALSPRQQEIARQMFLSLVHVQHSGTATRRQISQDDLFDEVNCEEAELEVVLDRFVEGRLLVIDDTTVEITHEALMVAWPTLRVWLDADRGSRLVAQQVVADARAWDQAKRPVSDLYSASRLQSAQAWRTNYPADVTELSQAFIDASVRQSQKRTRRLWGTIAALTVLVMLTGTLAVVVSWQKSDLKQQRDEAQSRTLASQASILRHKDVNLARQLALAAYQISPTTEARSALIEATALPPAVRMLGGKDSGIMYAVGIHPGGAVAAAAVEGTVRFWNLADAGHPAPLPALPGSTCRKFYALAFSPSGDLLAGPCNDGTIRLWNTRNPKAPVALPALRGLGAKVYSVAFSPDGGLMAAAIAEPEADGVAVGSIRLWSVTGSAVQPLSAAVRVDDAAPAKSVSFRNNQQLAVGTDDGTVQLWDISSPDRPTDPVEVPGTTKAIGQLAFSPDGKLLAAGGADNLVHLWSTSGSRPRAEGKPIGGATSYINAVAFSPDGATLAIASSDGVNGIRLLDLASRRIIATLPHPAPVTSVKFSPDGKSVITGANDGTARLWPVNIPTLEGMAYIVSAARFSPDGKTLAIGSADLQLFDVTQAHSPHRLGPAVSNPDTFSGTVAFAPNGRLLAEGRGRSGTVQLWNVATPARLSELGPPLEAHSKQVEALAFSPDSTTLATGARDGSMRLWDVRTPERPKELAEPGPFDGMVTDIRFSPDGRLLVAGSADKTVRFWDVSNPRKPRPYGAPITPANHYVFSTVFSADGSLLAVGLADSTVRLYDVTEPGRPEAIGQPLTGPEGYVSALSFTSDSAFLAATATDGTVWLWDLQDRRSPTVWATLRTSTDAVYPVSYKPRSRTLVAGGAEKKAWIWNTDVTEATALICRTTGDPLTPEEWDKYFPPDRSYAPPCP